MGYDGEAKMKHLKTLFVSSISYSIALQFPIFDRGPNLKHHYYRMYVEHDLKDWIAKRHFRDLYSVGYYDKMVKLFLLMGKPK
jgi:hypothetical protein